MTIEELAKTVSDMQAIINTQNKTIEDMNKQYETNQQTISDLMKLNNELMLSVSGTSKEQEEKQDEKLESKLLGDYADVFDADTLNEFINIFEEGE